jgi:hypothetical protein
VSSLSHSYRFMVFFRTKPGLAAGRYPPSVDHVSKTSILPKGATDQSTFDMVRTIMETTLTHLTNEVLLDSFCPEDFIDIGVPIDTDVFVRSFVVKTCRDIIDDVEKP